MNKATILIVEDEAIVAADLESKLRSRLGTSVVIETRKNGQRGKIIIEFYSLDEFDRITEAIGLASLEEV